MGSIADHPPQISCWITHTNERTHEVIRANLDRSPMYSGVIEGVGPRYCPSIEDKIHRFADKASHQIFLEPEGLDDELLALPDLNVNNLLDSLRNVVVNPHAGLLFVVDRLDREGAPVARASARAPAAAPLRVVPKTPRATGVVPSP